MPFMVTVSFPDGNKTFDIFRADQDLLEDSIALLSMRISGIQAEIDSYRDPDPDWKKRAQTALRCKITEREMMLRTLNDKRNAKAKQEESERHMAQHREERAAAREVRKRRHEGMTFLEVSRELLPPEAFAILWRETSERIALAAEAMRKQKLATKEDDPNPESSGS